MQKRSVREQKREEENVKEQSQLGSYPQWSASLSEKRVARTQRKREMRWPARPSCLFSAGGAVVGALTFLAAEANRAYKGFLFCPWVKRINCH